MMVTILSVKRNVATRHLLDQEALQTPNKVIIHKRAGGDQIPVTFVYFHDRQVSIFMIEKYEWNNRFG